jgi:hypothetical protein
VPEPTADSPKSNSSELAKPASPDPDVSVTAPIAGIRTAAPAETSLHPASEGELLLAGAGVTTTEETDEQLIVGIRWRRAAQSLTGELRANAPADRHVGMGQIHIWRSEVSLSPCLHVGGFGGCLVASLGTIRGSATGLTAGRSAFTPLVSGGLRVTWEHAVASRVVLRLHADLVAIATTTRFDVDHMPVWSSQPVEASAGIGFLMRFL